MLYRKVLRLYVALLALLGNAAFAQSASPTGDILTYSSTPNANYGSCTSPFVQKGSISSNRYIKFQPAGTGIKVQVTDGNAAGAVSWALTP
jgi:hypothetical protein